MVVSLHPKSIIMEKKETFTVTQALSLENSWGVLKADDSIELEMTVCVKERGDYGWFEFYDLETGGDEWYGEGGLWIKGNAVVEYDGVFSVPPAIISKLEEWGYNCEEIKCDLGW